MAKKPDKLLVDYEDSEVKMKLDINNIKKGIEILNVVSEFSDNLKKISD